MSSTLKTPLLCILVIAAASCQKESAPVRYPTVTVARQDITVSVSADGVVEPLRTVEVKSKASGEIVAIEADTGDRVRAGQVLLELLPRDAQNAHDQAVADLDASRSRLENAKVQLGRTRRLHADGLLPQSDVETAELAATTARTEVVRSQKNLDSSSERLAETTVRSPIDGTVIAREVEIGQVISSAVSQVSGGSVLFSLADLGVVHVRSLVDEVDIGKLRPGMAVTLTLEAYPERTFSGTLVKIEPQAVVQQNVTMFPTLTRLENPEGLLKPGMNADVEVRVEERQQVLALPPDALKSHEQARQLAAILEIPMGGERGGEPGGERGERRSVAGERKGARGEGGGAGALERGGERGGQRGDERKAGATAEGRSPSVRWVFRSKGGVLEPAVVGTGLRSWDYCEITEGLAEGDEVALLPDAEQLRQNQERRERFMRSRGIPGMSQGGSRTGGGRSRSGGQ